jgi:hypothetical protein
VGISESIVVPGSTGRRVFSYHGSHPICPTRITHLDRIKTTRIEDPYASPFSDFYFHALFDSSSRVCAKYGYLKWKRYERKLWNYAEIQKSLVFLIRYPYEL